MTDNQESQQQKDESEMSPKQWVQENLRIIISIVIVVALAGGIYSYSQRTQQSQKIADEETEEMISDDQVATEEGESEETTTDGVVESGEQKGAEQKDSATSPAPSQETAQSFVETAVRGDGTTHLARRALADYLEKNPDSTLTAEHKIYIEDYLRKNVNGPQRVHVGTTVEFSKDLIRTAIERSKQLNDAQLKNLHKYAVQVPSLS